MGPGLFDAFGQIEDPQAGEGNAASPVDGIGPGSARRSLIPAAGAAREAFILYRVIKNSPLNVREAHLVRLIQKAIRKKSAWGADFTSTELAARIEAVSGDRATASELISLLDMHGVFSRGTGQHPSRRKIADLRRALPEMVLAARRTERRRYDFDLG